MTLLTSRHTFRHLLGVTLRGELREQAALCGTVCAGSRPWLGSSCWARTMSPGGERVP